MKRSVTTATTTSATSTPVSKPHVLRRAHVSVDNAFCAYAHRPCMQNKLDGFDYCLRHILEEKGAPYRQCSYTSARNGQRCPHATPKTDKREGYCASHARKVSSLRQKTNRKRRLKETPQSLLAKLRHHVTPSPPAGEVGRPSDVRRMRAQENSANRILECASSSDSDAELTLVEQTWRGGDMDSDADSIDAEQEDPLRHAGIYTAEEVALLTRDKLIRLQSLYIDQFKRLQHVLREERRRLIHARRTHRQTSASSQADPAEHRDKLAKLSAVKRYHRRYGKEALLHRQSKERRISVSEGSSYRPPAYPKCIHLLEGSTRCSSRTLPLSKFCEEHILHDSQQVLFAQCSLSGGACRHPVPVCTPDGVCGLHTCPPAIVQRLPVKQSTDDAPKEEVKEELTIDVVGPDIKTEPVETDSDCRTTTPPVTTTQPPDLKLEIKQEVDEQQQQQQQQLP